MTMLHGLPYFEVQLTKSGEIFRPREAEALLAFVADRAPTDLIVIAHGWNNDLEDARDLYDRLFRSIRRQLDLGTVPLDQRQLAIAALFWPSKTFTDVDLIPGGAAHLGPGSSTLRRELERLMEPSDIGGDVVEPEVRERLERAVAAASRIDDSPAARRELVDALRGLLPAGDAEIEAEVPAELRDLDGDELLGRLGTPPPLAPPTHTGGAAGGVPTGGIPDDPGGAAGLANLFAGIQAGARQLLNLTTYFTMKFRAGTVGERGAAALVRDLTATRGELRCHLVGHSFGARLVSATATAVDQPVSSMVLLQAAFSHHGFAPVGRDHPRGVFRRAVAARNVEGPILITHTANDRAVGLAYPVASRIARHRAQSLGGPEDVYGGLGRNGAQDTPEAAFATLLPAGTRYRLAPGQRVHNLLADRFIDDHSDVKGDEVAHAILSAISMT